MAHHDRFTGEIEGDFVLFLIGARLNDFRATLAMMRVGAQMSKMQVALAKHPEIGCLGMNNWFGRTTMSVQYWRDFESLERFARSSDQPHLEPWREFNRLVRKSGRIGIYHETYLVPAGSHESIYVNLPLRGLGAAGQRAGLDEESRAAGRLGEFA